jgi:pimeloyl-ACP methyl ester carboxylesterase
MNEHPLLFGPEGSLMGILTTPAQVNPASVACLLLNVGLTHRIGPRRLNVKLARQLARDGIPSLRLDLSGIGDSPPARSRTRFREQAVGDLRAAMDQLEASTGIRRFVVLGICSGATNGYWLAQTDARVVGLLMFDGFTFPTLKTQLIHDVTRIRHAKWGVVLSKGMRRIRRLFGDTGPKGTSIFNDVSDLTNPSRGEFQSVMDSLTARGVAVYLIYSGSLLVQHNYHAQLQDAFPNAPFLGRIRYDYMPDVDHTPTPLAAQRKLADAMCEWVGQIAQAPPGVAQGFVLSAGAQSPRLGPLPKLTG